jgi:hypothetical protein
MCPPSAMVLSGKSERIYEAPQLANTPDFLAAIENNRNFTLSRHIHINTKEGD